MLSIISKLPTPTLKCFLDKLSVVYSVNNILIDERLCTWIDQNRRKKKLNRDFPNYIPKSEMMTHACIEHMNTKNADWDLFSFRSISLHFLSYKVVPAFGLYREEIECKLLQILAGMKSKI